MNKDKIRIKLHAHIHLSNSNYQDIEFTLIYDSKIELEVNGTTNKIIAAFEKYKELYPKTKKNAISFDYTYSGKNYSGLYHRWYFNGDGYHGWGIEWDSLENKEL